MRSAAPSPDACVRRAPQSRVHELLPRTRQPPPSPPPIPFSFIYMGGPLPMRDPHPQARSVIGALAPPRPPHLHLYPCVASLPPSGRPHLPDRDRKRHCLLRHQLHLHSPGVCRPVGGGKSLVTDRCPALSRLYGLGGLGGLGV